MMTKAGLATTILVIAAGIYDLVLVCFYGTGSSISNFLVNAGFKDPVIVFSLGFVMGHCFGYFRPVPEK